MVLLASLTLTAVVIELSQPYFFKKVVDTLAAGQPVSVAVKALFLWSLTFWVRLGVRRFYNFTLNKFDAATMQDVMATCFSYIHGHSQAFFNDSFVGSLVTKVKRYEKSLETVSDQTFYDLSYPFLYTLGTLIIFSFFQPLFALCMLVWLVIYFVVSFYFFRYKIPFDLKKSNAETDVTGYLADTITNTQNVRLFGGEQREKKGFWRVTEILKKARMRSWNLHATYAIFQSAFMIILELALLYYAIVMWGRGLFTIGDFVLVEVYLERIFSLLWDINAKLKSLYEGIADANEMTEILLKPHEVQDSPGAAKLEVIQGAVAFTKVGFAYGGKHGVYEDFNLSIKPREKVALVGPSGGGKTTFVKLLFRFMDVTGGEITIDGQDISKVTQTSLREALSLVPQDPILFHRSLYENIRYGKPYATEAEVLKAAKLARCHEFISKLPVGYSTLVGERGVKLSGGERQRVAIARAILKNSPILVLDEATSSLDSESEQDIQAALDALMKDKTVIVIAHRLSTIMRMDRIIVIENGKISESGSHKQLLHLEEGTYQKLWQIQAGGFA